MVFLITLLSVIVVLNIVVSNILKKVTWDIFEKNIQHLYKVYDIAVQSELNDYDSATESYYNLRKEFVNFYFSSYGGRHQKELIRQFFAKKEVLVKYLESCFDIRYSKLYLSITPSKSNS